MEKGKKAFAYPPSVVNYLQTKMIFSTPDLLWDLLTRMSGQGVLPEIKTLPSSRPTAVDEFWSTNTVYAPSIRSAFQSQMNIEWRFRAHPMFKELTGLFGDHDHEVILDYGCGPGNDLAGFATRSRASKVIGMDISYKSLSLAAHRLALHKVEPARIELIQIHDGEPGIPLPNESVDFISCQGVLMHSSYPEKILSEFFRVLKPNSNACIMVYSRPSVWFDLYTAYEQMVLKNEFSGMTVEQAFSTNTDGRDCPMARCYPVDVFARMCMDAGFECKFAGGYFTETEMISLKRYLSQSLYDPRLAEKHKNFLRELSYDDGRYPKFQGYYAGVSGVYHVHKN